MGANMRGWRGQNGVQRKNLLKKINFFCSKVKHYTSAHIYIRMKHFFIRSWLFARLVKRQVKEDAAEAEALSLLEDTVFKFLFGFDSEGSREALRSLLSACIRREVKEVQIVNSEVNPPYLGAKQSRLDVHVTFNDGEAADLEMQACKTNDDIGKRAEYYAVMLVAGQDAKGKTYRDIKRVYQIFFINDVLFKNSDKIPRRYYYQEETERDRLSNLTEIIFYELPKMEKLVNECLKDRTMTKFLTKEEKWCIYLRYRHEKGVKTLINQLSKEEEGIMRAEKEMPRVSRTYKRYVRNLSILKYEMDKAQQKLEYREAYERAFNEGFEIGFEEGIEIGREKFKNKFKQYLLDLVNQGLSTEEIKKRFSLYLENKNKHKNLFTEILSKFFAPANRAY